MSLIRSSPGDEHAEATATAEGACSAGAALPDDRGRGGLLRADARRLPALGQHRPAAALTTGTHRWDRKAIDFALDRLSGLPSQSPGEPEENDLDRWIRERCCAEGGGSKSRSEPSRSALAAGAEVTLPDTVALPCDGAPML